LGPESLELLLPEELPEPAASVDPDDPVDSDDSVADGAELTEVPLPPLLLVSPPPPHAVNNSASIAVPSFFTIFSPRFTTLFWNMIYKSVTYASYLMKYFIYQPQKQENRAFKRKFVSLSKLLRDR
jgi:hypothetical protein